MSPGQNHVRLRAQAPQVGEGRQNRFDQLAGQRAESVRQIAAEHFGQSADRLALAIAGARGVQPVALVTQKVVKPAHWTAGVLQKT